MPLQALRCCIFLSLPVDGSEGEEPPTEGLELLSSARTCTVSSCYDDCEAQSADGSSHEMVSEWMEDFEEYDCKVLSAVCSQPSDAIVDGPIRGRSPSSRSLHADVIPPGLAPNSSNTFAGRRFEIKVHRRPGERLGLILDSYSNGAILVSAINPGPIARWNTECPHLEVEIGQWIVMVNGVAGDCMAMMSAANADVVHMTMVKRAQ
eukprot:NODE_19266_length_851_cov_8.718232.p1 GENE.NODE_19266_length_851_cov_8.718232~~NODE_19266_length_851_cov_8.718232.p1  ORF type:complete len:207 (+),score=38.25 NODE_19266_length_851_cov_8.718232:89-709(+)